MDTGQIKHKGEEISVQPKFDNLAKWITKKSLKWSRQIELWAGIPSCIHELGKGVLLSDPNWGSEFRLEGVTLFSYCK